MHTAILQSTLCPHKLIPDCTDEMLCYDDEAAATVTVMYEGVVICDSSLLYVRLHCLC